MSIKKLGHRRVTQEGTVTYKKKSTSELQSAIQLGLSNIIGRKDKERDILLRDFQFIETEIFPSRGGRQTPAHSYGDFQFITFAPIAFNYFRNLFKVDKSNYLNSVCIQELRELSNPGASGSVFFISADDEFIIKTVQSREANFLRKLLPQYYMTLKQHKRTLLPKFYGLHCYQSMGKNIRFVIMNNLLPSRIEMHEKYDLKGSMHKRRANQKELAKSNPTYKDKDFLRRHPSGFFLRPETYDALKRTLNRDCLVLNSFSIMDYSFLLGVHNLSEARRHRETEGGTPKSSVEVISDPTAKHSIALEDTSVSLNVDEAHSNENILTLETGQNGVVIVRRVAAYCTPMAILENDTASSCGNASTSTRSSMNRLKPRTAANVNVLMGASHTAMLYDRKEKWLLPPDQRNPNLSASTTFLPPQMARLLAEEGGPPRTSMPDRLNSVNSSTITSNSSAQSSLMYSPSDSDYRGSSNILRGSTSTITTASISLTPEDPKNPVPPAITVIESTNEELESMGGISAWNKEGEHLLLFIGIIDILQNYRLRKRMEHAFKSLVGDGDRISVTEPQFYSDRFQNFLMDSVFHKLPADTITMIPSSLQCETTTVPQLPNALLPDHSSSLPQLGEDSLSWDSVTTSSLSHNFSSYTVPRNFARSEAGVNGSPKPHANALATCGSNES